MIEWVNVIKNCAIEAVEASKPTKLEFGRVLSISPLKIELNQKLTLTREFLTFTDTVYSKGFKVDDVLLLVQMQGGQTYVVLDKVRVGV